jgi:hypothetical protein
MYKRRFYYASLLNLKSSRCGKSKEIEDPKGLHSKTFTYVKTSHYFVFEMTNQKLKLSKFRKPSTCHIGTSNSEGLVQVVGPFKFQKFTRVYNTLN